MISWLISRLLTKACPREIPMGRPEANNNDCYSICLCNQKGKGKALVDNFNSQNSFIVKHYYRNHQKEYKNIFWLYINYNLCLWKTTVRLKDFLEALLQWVFNRKNLVTKNRVELLKFVLNDSLSGDDDQVHFDEKLKKFYPTTILNKLHTDKWILHPNRLRTKKELVLYLDSLVDTGELKKEGSQYSITSKALVTIEEAEKSDRRHSEIISTQRVIAALTAVLAIAAFISILKT